MSINVIPANELSDEHHHAWSAIRSEHREFDSPYLAPEYMRAVGAVRDDVYVAVISANERPVGFFPFQRDGRHGRPVGGPLCDYQAVIAAPDVPWTAASLIKACGLSCWDFNHLPARQESFQPFFQQTAEFAFIDTTNGLEGVKENRRSKSDGIRETMRKARKAERDVGPWRFEFRSADTARLQTLLRWKSAQYHRSNLTDVFAFPWTVELVQRLHQQTGDFGGVLSLLYCGEQLMAGHFGIRCGRVLHWWFPAYDIRFSKHSAGNLLMIEAIEACQASGIDRIDLGKVSPWKERLLTGTRTVGEGSLDFRPLGRILRSTFHHTKEWVKSSRLYGPARVPGRMVNRLREWLEYK